MSHTKTRMLPVASFVAAAVASLSADVPPADCSLAELFRQSTTVPIEQVAQWLNIEPQLGDRRLRLVPEFQGDDRKRVLVFERGTSRMEVDTSTLNPRVSVSRDGVERSLDSNAFGDTRFVQGNAVLEAFGMKADYDPRAALLGVVLEDGTRREFKVATEWYRRSRRRPTAVGSPQGHMPDYWQAFSPDGLKVAGVYETAANWVSTAPYVFELKTGWILSNNTPMVEKAFAWHPSSCYFATVRHTGEWRSRASEVRIYNLVGEELQGFNTAGWYHTVAFSQDGRRLIMSPNKAVPLNFATRP